jgi:tetratricopeptide (TPR) repeat protein
MRHAWEIKGFCLGLQGDWDEAIEIFKKVYQMTNHPLKGLTPLAFGYAKTGQLEKVNECIAKTEQRMIEEPDVVAEADLAVMWLALGDRDKAIHYMTRAVDKRMPVCYALHSPLLDDLLDDPRLTDIKKRMNL